MIAATIAVGDDYQRAAELAVDSARRCLGLDPVVITDVGGLGKPSMWKLKLLDEFPGETVLYFDADARFLKPWDVREFDDTPWPVVVQDWASGARDHDCRHYGIAGDRYFASGFWIANGRHADVWRTAWEIATASDYATKFRYEQTALNVAVQRARLPLVILDRRYWWIPTLARRAPPDVVTVALGGGFDGPDRPAYDEALKYAT
jgi:hypothetical protein